MGELSHLDDDGAVHMIDVSGKPMTQRTAHARATIALASDTSGRLFSGDLPKGDALATVRIAAIQGVKRTSELIPLCHPLAVSSVTVEVVANDGGAQIDVIVGTNDRTGVEMEAMTGASVGALTLYDMVKGIDRGAEVTSVRLISKSGGRSGEWRREP